MIYVFRVLLRGSPVVACKFYNIRPVRQEPGFEIVLCRMRVEASFRADPFPHLGFGVRSVLEFSRPGVDISQGDYRVGGSMAIAQKVFNNSFELFALWYWTMIRKGVNIRHPAMQAGFEESPQMR